MTGTRLLLTLTLELGRRGLKRGLAAACIGGGQGIAAIVERSDGPRRNPELPVPNPGEIPATRSSGEQHRSARSTGQSVSFTPPAVSDAAEFREVRNLLALECAGFETRES